MLPVGKMPSVDDTTGVKEFTTESRRTPSGKGKFAFFTPIFLPLVFRAPTGEGLAETWGKK
jgi:hypothetical protein